MCLGKKTHQEVVDGAGEQSIRKPPPGPNGTARINGNMLGHVRDELLAGPVKSQVVELNHFYTQSRGGGLSVTKNLTSLNVSQRYLSFPSFDQIGLVRQV